MDERIKLLKKALLDLILLIQETAAEDSEITAAEWQARMAELYQEVGAID